MLTIIDNSLNGVKFTDLGVGATFKYDDYYYIVTEKVDTQTMIINSVRLDNGVFTYFDADDIVIPFNCELIVL